MKRRDVLKAVATTPAIFGGAMVSRAAFGQLCRPEGLRTPGTEPDSPPVRHFTEPLFVPPPMQPVDPATLLPPPDPDRHQRFREFPPKKYYVQSLTEGLWNYHRDLSRLNPLGFGSLAWMFNGMTPGETLVARYGEPVFVRRYNDLPPDRGCLDAFWSALFHHSSPQRPHSL